MAALNVFFFGLFLVLGLPSLAVEIGPTNNTNPLTSHVLDQATGRPASSISIVLYRMLGHTWKQVSEKSTNDDGRVGHMIPGPEFTPGLYKLKFDTASYYKNLQQKTFYPYVEIVFEVDKPEEHYHIPLLLNAYGYATYRGS